MPPRLYPVRPVARQPLVDFMTESLGRSGCRIVSVAATDRAPFRMVIETPARERIGLVAYAFFANSVRTRNRPEDEGRFQLKYGAKDGALHELWQDPDGLYTTLLVGIDPFTGVWVAADPVLHSPTRMFISVEFKRDTIERARKSGWETWERDRRVGVDGPIETMIAGNASTFLDLIQFERAAVGLPPGDRMLLATTPNVMTSPQELEATVPAQAVGSDLHELETAFEMSGTAILDLIQRAPRLRMAVRGWVAEEHLFQYLSGVDGVSELEPLEIDGQPDMRLRYRGSPPVTVECKTVLRRLTAAGQPRLDFQRTRAAISDRCSRYYRPDDFDLVAACLHPVTARWEFRFQRTDRMATHGTCAERLASNVIVDAWTAELGRLVGGPDD